MFPARRDKHEDALAPTTQKLTPQAAPRSQTMIPLTPVASAQSPDLLLSHPGITETKQPGASPTRKNVHRSRLMYAIFTLFVFLATAVAASFVESAVVGYVLWAVYTAGHFNISTCVSSSDVRKKGSWLIICVDIAGYLLSGHSLLHVL